MAHNTNTCAVPADDPARAIWGDAVIDRAEEINREIERTGTGYNDRRNAGYSGWHHASKYNPALGQHACIVGHLNFIAAELRGIDPVHRGMDAWPSADGAFSQLKAIAPETPDTVPVQVVTGGERKRTLRYSTRSIMGAMISDHDHNMNALTRIKTAWWGRKAYERMVRLLNPKYRPAPAAEAATAEAIAALDSTLIPAHGAPVDVPMMPVAVAPVTVEVTA